MTLRRWLIVCGGLLSVATGCIAVKEVSVTRPRYQAVSADGKLYVVDTYRRVAYPVVRQASDDAPAPDDRADPEH